MGTKVSVVYSSFLNKISDYKLTVNEDGSNVSILEKTLFNYLVSGSSHFLTARKDLTMVGTGEELAFVSDLSPLEIEILAKLMLVEYIKPIIIRNETVEQALSDSDFVIYSQANHIQKLLELNATLKSEVNYDMQKYSYAVGGKIYGNYKK